MNQDKYTDRAKGFVQAAQTLALRENHQQFAPEHLLKALMDADVKRESIQTAWFSVHPVYDHRGESPRLQGYMATNTVTVRITELDEAGRVIDDAIRAGGDLSRFQGLSFGLERREEAVKRAREAAVVDAQRAAEQLAKAAGVAVGPVLHIAEIGAAAPRGPSASR
ncbi:MAG: SIMPL domain-containing protein [Myxococcales bacterium]|nr:SIMPL domain-containing protein [Myxococcales bacterium]